MSPDSAPAGPSHSADEVTGPVEPPVSVARRSAVDRARRQWVDRLIDPSRRNNLLYFRDLQTGSLDLSQASAEARAALLRSGTGEGEGVSLSSLVGEDVLPRATVAVREIQKRAVANFEERGLATMFVAAGLATWPAEDGGRPVASPVVLLPVEAASRGRSGAWSVPPTTRRPRPATATACGSSTSRRSGGGSTASGPRTGSRVATKRWSAC